MKMHMLGNGVLVKPFNPPTEQITASGIIIPESAQVDGADAPETGIVIDVGPGYTSDHGVQIRTNVKPGMKVIFRKHTGYIVKDGVELYLMFREPDLLAYYTDEED